MTENLPQSPESHNQERRSAIKFELLTPEELFLVRTESGGDYGVDRVLEVRKDVNLVTNLRAHVQLKSVANAVRNQDGTFSFPVPISTLNYLMNQPNSIFTVYLENEDCFLWSWVLDIYNTAQSKGIDITNTEQGTFTYRFSEVLDRDSYNEIHTVIETSGRIIRKLNEITTTVTKAEELNSAIILQGKNIVDLKELGNKIRIGGISLVNSGHIGLVNDLINKLQVEVRADSEIALVAAYAKFNGGQILDALSWLPRGQAREELSSEKRVLSRLLEISIHFSLNIINSDQYSYELTKLESDEPNSLISLQIKFERQRGKLLLNNIYESQALNEEIEDTMKTLSNHPQVDESIKLEIEVVKWEKEGLLINSILLNTIFDNRIKLSTGYPIGGLDTLSEAYKIIKRRKEWYGNYQVLREKAKSNPIIWGKLIIAFAHIELQSISTQYSIAGVKELDDKEKVILEAILDDLVKSNDLMIKLGIFQIGLRGKLLVADTLEGLGRMEESIELANEVKRIAEQIGQNELVEIANQYLAGKTMFKLKLDIEESTPSSPYQIAEAQSDEELQKMAKSLLRTYNLPQERYDNIYKDLWWMREDGRDRSSFCQYIQSLQDLTHTESPKTLYSFYPPMKITCELLGYKSEEEGTNREELVKEFRKKFCNQCDKRS